MDWTITITYALPRALQVESSRIKAGLLESFAGRFPVITERPEAIGLTFDLCSPDLETAISEAKRRVDDVVLSVNAPPLRVLKAVITEGGYRDAEDLVDDEALVGIAEIADILRISRQRASAIAKERAFPKPRNLLRSGPVFRLSDVRTYATDRGRPHRDA